MKYSLLIIGLFFSAPLWAASCPVTEGLFVQTSTNRMSICEANQTLRTYEVALGRHGIGKERRGDAKTPVGAYGLGRPRGSQDFGIFVPINYPTPRQKRLGYTGSDVGLHGPSRFFSGMNLRFNWTDGCIALASYYEIRTVAAWIKNHPRASIYIQ